MGLDRAGRKPLETLENSKTNHLFVTGESQGAVKRKTERSVQNQ